MNTLTPTGILLQETKEAFANVRGSVVVAMQRLYKVHESDAWQGVCSSWSEYVESELGISQSFASKLLSVNNHYLVQGGLDPEIIAGIDYEKLNMVRSLPGTLDEHLSMARTLSRKEIRDSFGESIKCEHPKTYVICADCGTRIYDAE